MNSAPVGSQLTPATLVHGEEVGLHGDLTKETAYPQKLGSMAEALFNASIAFVAARQICSVYFSPAAASRFIDSLSSSTVLASLAAFPLSVT